MAEKRLYSGIFNEEICVQFLYICEMQIQNTFKELFDECSNKKNSSEIFKHCLQQVQEWGEPIFLQEHKNFSAFSDCDDLFRSTFVMFVKSYFNRPGSPKMHIRLTVPPLTFFVRQLILQAVSHPYIISGQFFISNHITNKRDCTIEILRKCLKNCVQEYVIAQELHDSFNNNKETTPHVSEWDSASNIGANQILNDECRSQHLSDTKYKNNSLLNLKNLKSSDSSGKIGSHTNDSFSKSSKAKSPSSVSSIKEKISHASQISQSKSQKSKSHIESSPFVYSKSNPSVVNKSSNESSISKFNSKSNVSKSNSKSSFQVRLLSEIQKQM